MTPRAVNPRQAIEACTLQLHAWKPFQIHSLPFEPPKPDSFRSKKPCRSDRSTAPPLSIDGLDLTRLSLVEEPLLPKAREERGFRWLAVARKRRRRGSRSVSGRSSDRSGTWRQAGGGGGSVAYATCSDFPIVAGGTDSSGEFFVSGDGSWASDVSEARVWRKDGREGGGGGLEREGLAFGSYPAGLDSQGNESGYGSEPGYRGDGEFGYGDELDEEDEDGKQLFWGGGLGDEAGLSKTQLGTSFKSFSSESKRMDIVNERIFSEQKAHHRCRRKKNDWRMFAPLRKPIKPCHGAHQ